VITAEQVANLAGHCATWDARDPFGPHADARTAVDLAMDDIDVLLAELHLLRNHLVAEMRVDDDLARMRRVVPVDAVEVPAEVMARIDAHTVDLSGFGTS
jgi:hypothetical protein